jgi:hypothetical protein
MVTRRQARLFSLLLAGGILSWGGGVAVAQTLNGKVLGGGQPITNSTVTLWAASEGTPQQLGQARTGADGGFTINSTAQTGSTTLYLIAKGGQPKAQGDDNPGLAFLAVLGDKPPAAVTINEFTTVASVWTHNQFIDGTAIKGPALGLRIAAGNVPNFVDVATGGYGTTIADALNSAQTPTIANFATLANVIAGCATRVTADACPQLYIAATPPKGATPNDTLTAAQSIARYPSYQPEKIFALLEKFYPVPTGKRALRPTPFMPYLTFAPSAWVLPLKFTGGGYHAGGKLMFDSQGNVWNANNMQAGSQTQDSFWQGTASKFAPDGKPLSPVLTGFTGGGLLGPGFGLAIDANDNAWMTSFAGNNNVVLFDKNGKPLSPPEGYTFGGKLAKCKASSSRLAGMSGPPTRWATNWFIFPRAIRPRDKSIARVAILLEIPVRSCFPSHLPSTRRTTSGSPTSSAITSPAFPLAIQRRLRPSRPVGPEAVLRSTVWATSGSRISSAIPSAVA